MSASSSHYLSAVKNHNPNGILNSIARTVKRDCSVSLPLQSYCGYAFFFSHKSDEKLSITYNYTAKNQKLSLPVPPLTQKHNAELLFLLSKIRS